jgi:pilus assembly protein Flp/PilA
MKAMIKRFFQEEEAASAVEYGLLVALIGVMLIVGMQALQGSISSTFTAASTAMDAASS